MTLQLKFDHSKKFQLDAIESTVKLFEGQQKFDASFVDFIDGVVPNKLTISETQILENLKDIQKQNQIPISEELDGMNFSIEMETGTGKTYVYLRSIYELNQKYGFKKFIIVVPSVAIREGVKKNFEITKNDFQVLYNKPPIQSTEYSSKNISYIRQFSNSNKIEVMVITRDSFNKDVNIMNTPQDKFYGKRPIDLVKKTNPILILDEPQNMEMEITKEAIANLNPLLTLRYSATHRNPYNLIYRLSPVDAYKQKLVKRIEVLSITEDANPNTANIECHAITTGKKIQAKLKVIKQLNEKTKSTLITVKHGDDLKEKTNSNQYEGYVISEINAARNFVTFSNGIVIKLGEKQGSNNQEIQRIQIRETIKNHLYRQEQLKDEGIKVLSLFFIDKVDNYLNGGILQKMFDEEFNQHKKENPDFKDLDPEKIRSGYFSKTKTTNKSIENDSEAFNLIMKEKEKLLSFSEPTCFIFSHSALREGWDNPNVFNICTLNQSISDVKKRQEIGRGLRLPVDQNGIQKIEKQYELTVIANESYEEYVKNLQNEYVADYGYSGAPPQIDNAKKPVYIKLDKNKLESKEFQELWSKISQKTSYFTTLDSEKLVKECINTINENLKTNSLKIKIDTISVDMEKEQDFMKLTWKKIGEAEEKIDQTIKVGNIANELSEKTHLTRKSIIKILTGINNLDLLFKNPQEFLQSITNIIKNILDQQIVNGIKYKSINDKFGQFRFEPIEKGYEYNTIDTSRSIYDKIRYDSEFEKEVSEYLNKDERVRLYLKMPDWFKIDTPIGTYNPDWGIVTEKRNPQGKYEKTLYFMAETKAKKETDLGLYEKLKIKCGQRHFKVLQIPFKVVKTISDLDSVEA